ncbi:CinA family protein [Amorphoplanes nipponensis]|uniref:Competence damage-inducible protein A n=1 Tax=Actinoplanes nipponensis TaxID=135950 RepID=A0A919JMD6_9ACTN|nr:CinA family protein [Actinoplanes nipponensis]GIE53261.1 competence damage-inducible protein A [Actinoplanes nipponensis]
MSEEQIDDPGVAAAAAVHALVERRQTLAVAESLTGGLLAATIVEIAGVSAVFRGGLVVYATELKHTLAGVPRQLLDERGPVDADVALALAEGARERCGSDWGLATTGVAGPEPQDGKPVGLVFVAVAGPGGATVRELRLPGSRADVRNATVTSVLSLLVAELRGSTAGIAS